MTRTIATLLLALLASAAAQCGVAPGGELDNLALEGFGSAYFRELRFDQQLDLVEFYGGVCVVGLDWVLLADRVLLTGLSGDLELRAEAPDLRLPGLVVLGKTLVATQETLIVEGVELSGAELSGSAASLELQLATNEITLIEPTLRGTSLLVVGERALLSGNSLTIYGAVATTCVCEGPPLYSVRGSAVTVDLDRGSFTVLGGQLRVGTVTIDLADEVEIDPADAASFELPFAITYEPDTPAGEGEGLGIEIPRAQLAPNLFTMIDLAGLVASAPLSGRALLQGRGRGVRFDFGLVDGGISSEVEVVAPLLEWLEGSFAVRNVDRASSDRLHEGTLGLSARTAVPLPSVGSLVGSADVLAAASSQAGGGTPISGARLGVALGFTFESLPTTVGSGRVVVDTAATLYPDLGARQLVFEVAPSWRVAAGPLTVELEYHRVWSDAGSPFTVKLDRRLPRSDLAALVALATASERTAVEAELDLRYDLLAGKWSEAEVHGSVASTAIADGTLRIDLDADLLGLITAGEAAWLEFGAGWRLPLAVGTAEVELRSRVELVPTARGLEWIDVAVAYPLVGEGATVTPYLAVDVAPLFAGRAPSVSGHGLELDWSTCCGTLVLGYRLDRAGFDLTLGVRLDSIAGAGTIAPEEDASP